MNVTVALSGGVDSSVAAKLLSEKGYAVSGAIMQLCPQYCDSEKSISDAKAVSERLGIPFYVFDATKDFGEKVIKNFILSYQKGDTPNPCIECNKYIKFEKFYDMASKLGAQKIATGHYARILYNEKSGRFELKRAVDTSKDQSYVLYNMTQEQLSRTLFPLGELTKAEIREIALSAGFHNAEKKDSQDICFVPSGDYASFIENYLGKPYGEGVYLDVNGNILGKNKGVINYTIGQRKGLGIALGKPAFVISKDAETNSVVLGDEELLFYNKIVVKDVNFISISDLADNMRVKAKLRYRHTEQPAVISPLGEGKVLLTFDEPQRAPSSGQSAVFYDEDTVVGGGIIERGIKDGEEN